MVSDLVFDYLVKSNIAERIVHRYDELPEPDYALSGDVEAIEEYDSGQVWFAHLAITINLSRVSDDSTMYARSFDLRQEVSLHRPEYVVQELSMIMRQIMTLAIQDLDRVFSKEYSSRGVASGMNIAFCSTQFISRHQYF